jgi:hypothetical protein
VHALHQRIVIVAAELAGQRFVFGQHRLLLAHAARHRIEHGGLRIEHRFLLDVGNLEALLHHEQAIVEARAARNDFQERRLAGAVTPDQADAFAGFKGKISVVEQRNVAESQLRGGEGNDSHDPINPPAANRWRWT